MLTPELTHAALLVVLSLHLLHHRLAKRHISFAEVASAAIVCIPPATPWMPGLLLITLHLVLIALQLVGSLWITRLSPTWSRFG